MPEGLISSARRQILLQILREDVQKGIYVGKNGEMVKPKRIVTAYVSNDNTNREEVIRSLEASGLVKVKENVDWNAEEVRKEEGEDMCDMFVLDWEKLQQIEEQKTKESILDKLQTLSSNGERSSVIESTPESPGIQKKELARIRAVIAKQKKGS